MSRLCCPVNLSERAFEGERVADKYSIGREEQDAYSLESQKKALAARADGPGVGSNVAAPSQRGRNTLTVVPTSGRARA